MSQADRCESIETGISRSAAGSLPRVIGSMPVEQRVEQLRQQVRNVEVAGRRELVGDGEDDASCDRRVTSTCPALDRLLPAGGFERGTLVEWLAPGSGMGAGTLAMLTACAACRFPGQAVHRPGIHPAERDEARRDEVGRDEVGRDEVGRDEVGEVQDDLDDGVLVVLDRQRRFYPPAALRWGVTARRLVVLQPDNEEDEKWALDQALRCEGVTAVWAELEQLDERSFRRYQLAAESSGVLGLFVRPGWVRGLPSWSEIQLEVRSWDCPRGWGFRVRVARCRGGTAAGEVRLEMDDRTGALRETAMTPAIPREATDECEHARALCLATQLAHPKTDRRSARA